MDRIEAMRARRAMAASKPRTTAAPDKAKVEADRKARNRAAFVSGLRAGLEGQAEPPAASTVSERSADEKARLRAAFRRGLREGEA